jgi:hypothetical protein
MSIQAAREAQAVEEEKECCSGYVADPYPKRAEVVRPM